MYMLIRDHISHRLNRRSLSDWSVTAFEQRNVSSVAGTSVVQTSVLMLLVLYGTHSALRGAAVYLSLEDI